MSLTTTKKIILGVVLLFVLGIAYYGISPLFRNIEVRDEAPVVGDNGEVNETFAPEKPIDMEVPEMEQASAGQEAEQAEQNVTGPFPVEGTLGHPASGFVRVFQTSTETVIRYEDFETINGPNLHVYLSKDLDAKEYIDLGPIRGTRGNINYMIPEEVNISEYNYILTWCVPFRVLFNYADIN